MRISCRSDLLMTTSFRMVSRKSDWTLRSWTWLRWRQQARLGSKRESIAAGYK